MGRSIQSIRQEVRVVADRWARAARLLREEDHRGGTDLAVLAMRHASDAFYGCDDPLEATLFSVFVELCHEHPRPEHEDGNVDP